jgi:hypothetical protein
VKPKVEDKPVTGAISKITESDGFRASLNIRKVSYDYEQTKNEPPAGEGSRSEA